MYRPLRLLQSSCRNCLGLPSSRISVSSCRESTLGCHTTGSLRRLFDSSFLKRSLLSANSHQTISYAGTPVMITAGVHIAVRYNHIFVTRTDAVSTSLSTQHFSTSSIFQSPNTSQYTSANRTTLKYIISIAIVVVGLSYAAVPLYRVFCQASGYGGTVALAEASEKVENMEPIRERELTIRFNADTSAAMLWQFKPHQSEIKLVPGETALAFYTARNPTDRPVTGIATYNVIPFEAGLYFNKIQCFCFEEQRLNPKEQVDMPVFFYIDPEFNDDPAMAKVDSITLSYTFFEAKEEENIQASLPATI